MRRLQKIPLACLEGAPHDLRVLGRVSIVGMSKVIYQVPPAGSIARAIVVPNEALSTDTAFQGSHTYYWHNGSHDDLVQFIPIKL